MLALLAVSSVEAALRFKRTGEATLGGADALAGVPAACEVGDKHVWVEVEGRGECVAFYATPGFANAKVAVVYFEGDIPLSYRRDEDKLSKHLRALERNLASLAAAYGVPYVVVARPGTFGSTGDHGARRKYREYLVMRAAIEALREKFGWQYVTLTGQSGGATITGALLVLGIGSVKCAVPASGGFDLTAMLDWHADRQGITVGTHREHPASLADSFNVMDRIGGLRTDTGRRIFVVGDPDDQITPFSQQRRFAERLRADGHHAELLQAKGAGPQRHGLSPMALKLAGMCSRGASDGEIRAAAGSR